METEKENHRLDVHSKVLLATSAINYLSNQYNNILLSEKSNPQNQQIDIDAMKEMEGELDSALDGLKSIITKFSKYSIENDVLNGIDAKHLKPIHDTLFKGNDELNIWVIIKDDFSTEKP